MLTCSGGVIEVRFDDDGQPHGAEVALVAVAKQLGDVPDGTEILRETSRTRQPQGARPVGLHRYRRQVASGAWRVAEAFLEVVRRAFWLRHAADWPLQDFDLEPAG